MLSKKKDTKNPSAWAAIGSRFGFFWEKSSVASAQQAGDVSLDPERLPRHVAIVMDGNGRWAKQKAMPRSGGHAAGMEPLRAVIRECDALGIEALSIFAFSTENWKRPQEEVDFLMGLLLKYFRSEIDELHEKKVCIRILGDVEGLPLQQRQAVCDAMEKTRDNTGLKLNIALNYGARAELLHAAQRLASRALSEGMAPEALTEADLQRELYTHDLPDVDVMIRTSGELRLSNFLLYQLAYAELIFNDVLWPDYTRELFRKDLKAYAERDRRFGRVK